MLLLIKLNVEKTQRMKILEIVSRNPSENPGGVESVADTISRKLKGKVELHFTFMEKDVYESNSVPTRKDQTFRIPFKDVPICRPLNKSIFNIWVLFYALKHRKEYDLIHINGDAGGLVSFIKSVPTVLTLHGNSLSSFLHVRREYSVAKRILLLMVHLEAFILESLAVRNTTYATAVSNAVKDSFRGQRKGKPFYVIYNGVDIDTFKPGGDKGSIFRSFGLNPRRIYAIWVGKDSIRKGLYTAVESVSRTDHVDLIVVGVKRNPHLESGRVHFIENVSSVSLVSLYQMSDILVFPTLYEGFSATVLEALSCSCVPIVYRQISSSEILDDKVDSYLVESPEDFYLILRMLEKNPETLVRARLAARQKAERFSADSMANAYEEIFLKSIESQQQEHSRDRRPRLKSLNGRF